MLPNGHTFNKVLSTLGNPTTAGAVSKPDSVPHLQVPDLGVSLGTAF